MRTGFCCFVLNKDGSRVKGTEFKNTTQTAIRKLSDKQAREKLKSICNHNVMAILNSINWVAKLPEDQRMFRIGSDVFPFWDHSEFEHFFDDEFMAPLKFGLAKAGDKAREHNIRLSFHPSQYCVINSETADVVEKSLVQLECHAKIVEMMGFGKTKQDFKINIHLNGRSDVIPVDKMSPVLKNCLTFENDERTGTLDRVLEICEKYDFPVVLDIHHYWCSTGEYIFRDDPRVQRVIDTWPAGVRPVMHISQSRDEFCSDKLDAPNRDELLKTCNQRDLNKHSDMIDNEAIVEYIVDQFRSEFDFQVEAKNKSNASAHLCVLMKKCQGE